MPTDCLDKIPLRLDNPIEINGRITYEISVPCGKCPRCYERRKMEWGFRMEKEMEISKNTLFTTLTYNPETVPYSKYGQKTLRPKDLQDFFKRLRQNQKRSKITIEHLANGLTQNDKIKYYACGEYGEENQRPHYHAIIFNVSRKNIEKSWGLGETHVVPANKETIGYVMKYLDKRLGQEKLWKKEPEYNTMSEGVGKSYISKNANWHKINIDILYVMKNNGIKIPMPRYYRSKIFNNDERMQQVILVEQTLLGAKNELISKIGMDKYSEKQRHARKVSEKKFKKKIKKRMID